jgi:hypothetical protein
MPGAKGTRGETASQHIGLRGNKNLRGVVFFNTSHQESLFSVDILLFLIYFMKLAQVLLPIATKRAFRDRYVEDNIHECLRQKMLGEDLASHWVADLRQQDHHRRRPGTPNRGIYPDGKRISRLGWQPDHQA